MAPHRSSARPGQPADEHDRHEHEGPRAAAAANQAKRICAGCPVRAARLADVMAWEQPTYRHGVVGGLSARERQALHRATRAREVAA